MTLFPWKHVFILCKVFKLCFHLTLGVLECIVMSVLRCFPLWSIPFRAETLRTEQTAQFLWLSLQNTFFETTHDRRASYLQQHYYRYSVYYRMCLFLRTSSECTLPNIYTFLFITNQLLWIIRPVGRNVAAGKHPWRSPSLSDWLCLLCAVSRSSLNECVS